MLEDCALTYEQVLAWFDEKIRRGGPRNPFAEGHVNIRRLMAQRRKLIESRKTDIGIKMFIKPHNI
jgi:hypothetical protein